MTKDEQIGIQIVTEIAKDVFLLLYQELLKSSPAHKISSPELTKIAGQSFDASAGFIMFASEWQAAVEVEIEGQKND